MSQYVNDAALRDLALQAGQEFAPCRTVMVEVQCLDERLLGRTQESPQLDDIDDVLSIVMARVPEQPSSSVRHGHRRVGSLVWWRKQFGPSRHGADNQVFEPPLAGIGLHA